MDPINDFERQALVYLLDGDNEVLATLRDQLAVATVSSREFTGVRFFTKFIIPESSTRLTTKRRITISDVHADVSGLEAGAGFILFVEDGVLDTLECYIFEDHWPTDAKIRRLYYLQPDVGNGGRLIEAEKRDLDWATAPQSISD